MGKQKALRVSSRWFNLSLFLLFFCIPGNSQNKSSYNNSFADFESRLNSNTELESAIWSFSVRDEKGQLVAESSLAGKLVQPASVQKLLSSAYAMEKLGPYYSFDNSIFIVKPAFVSDNEPATIVLEASGDPSLGSNRFGGKNREAVLDFWIKQIEQNVKAGTSIYLCSKDSWTEHLISSWAWDDIGNYFAPMIDGLSLGENQLDVTLSSPATINSPVEVRSSYPRVPGLQIESEVLSAAVGSGDQAWVYSSPLDNRMLIRGTIPLGHPAFKIRASLPDPDKNILAMLALQLREQGWDVEVGQFNESWSGNLLEIGKIESVPIFQMLAFSNQRSSNFYAESLLRSAADPDPSKAAKMLHEWLESALPEEQLEDWKIEDGSGLSGKNRISSSELTRLLSHWRSESWFKLWFEGLASSGQSGTMLRFKRLEAGSVRAKSGSLSGVKSYAGYARGLSGSWYSFAFVLNQHSLSSYEVRQITEDFMLKVTELP